MARSSFCYVKHILATFNFDILQHFFTFFGLFSTIFNYFAYFYLVTLREDPTYINVYITWLYLVVMYIVPFACLAVFNLLIYDEVCADDF